MGNFSFFSAININASKYFDVDKITTKREKNRDRDKSTYKIQEEDRALLGA